MKLKFVYILFLSFLIADSSYEKIDFISANPFTFRDIILDLENQESQNVFGILRLPENNQQKKYPLIIGVAGSNGWGDHHHEFLSMYRKMGIATLELKSFESRGVKSTVGSQVEVTTAMMILDSYRALDAISKHPNIEKTKVAITGWSLGGGVSLLSSWLPLIKAIKPKEKFVAHLPFYPPCIFQPEVLEFTDAPIHILIGELDDWTPADACVSLIEELKSKNYNANITVYEKSHHSFDSNLPIEIAENGYRLNDCMFKMRGDGTILMNYFNIPVVYPFLQKIALGLCAERGPTFGGNEISRAKAFDFSKDFMKKYLLSEQK